MDDVLSLVLGGGRGARLYPLTQRRSEPAVPLAGKYRLIDIPISNCINSGLNRVYILTQYLSVSLHKHIAATYKFDPFSRGFIEVLAAQQTNEAADWYQGTADAVRQNSRYVQSDSCRDVLVLSGDQLYRMDFSPLVHAHRDSRADVTLAAVPVSRDQASDLGIVRLGEGGRVTDFVEKPQREEELAPFRMPSAEPSGERGGRDYLASMGIYLFRREVLLDVLQAVPLATDFARDVFPRSLAMHRVQAHLFGGYWQDLGTVRSYYEANLALAGDDPPFDFHTLEGVIYTRMRYLPASHLGGARLDRCLVSDGCVVQSGAKLDHCVLGVRSVVSRKVSLRGVISFGAHRYETDAERADNCRRGIPDIGIGENTLVERAIVDKDARIGRDVQIVNRQGRHGADAETYTIRDGIVVIHEGAVIPDGTVI